MGWIVPSQHCFRGARRHAARLKQQATIEELQLEVQRLEKEVRVERRYEVITVPVEKIVERIVEVPVEKVVEVVVEPAYDMEEKIIEDMEEKITKAFELGTQLANKAKDELAEDMMQRMRNIIEDKVKVEDELKESRGRERKMKEMLAKVLAQHKEDQPVEKIVEKFVEVPKIIEKVIEVPKVVEKIIEVPKIVEATEEEKLRLRIAELMECEVPLVIAREVLGRCCKPGEHMNEEELLALFDCGVFDELRLVEQRFIKRLRQALGEEVSASGSEAYDEDAEETTDSEYNELDGNEAFRKFEREEEENCDVGLEGNGDFVRWERGNG